MVPAKSREMILARQRRATSPHRRWGPDPKERQLQAFGAFMRDFARDLNQLSEDGWAVLVEGKRDGKALRLLGYTGTLVTIPEYVKKGAGAFAGAAKVAILTDLDREGGTLAARFAKKLASDAIRASLSERRRLSFASRGVFLHVENLSRFAEQENAVGKQEFISPRNFPEFQLSERLIRKKTS